MYDICTSRKHLGNVLFFWISPLIRCGCNRNMNLSFFSYWVKRLKLEVEIYYIYLSRPIIIGQLFVKKKGGSDN